MKKKIIYECDNIIFDSDEELEFYHWIQEALKYKVISDWKYNHLSYPLSSKKSYNFTKQLKTKTKIVEKHLFHEHSYKPDFHIYKGDRWNILEKHNLLTFHDDEKEFVIDTKGTFQRNDGNRSFTINQKWMYDKHGIYVNKVIPEKFFKLTWLPEKCRFTRKKKQLRKKYENVPTLFEKYGNIKS